MAAPKPNPPFILLQRLQKVKQSAPPPAQRLGEEMVQFFRQNVEKRQKKLGPVSEAWNQLVPQMLLDHCSIEGLARGTLTVLVDSSAHLYELRQLLLAGVEKQLIGHCRTAGLRKIALKPGRWYAGDSPRDRKIVFDG